MYIVHVYIYIDSTAHIDNFCTYGGRRHDDEVDKHLKKIHFSLSTQTSSKACEFSSELCSYIYIDSAALVQSPSPVG